MTRLVIFTTHPIQYQAPWFRALAATDGLDAEVVFSYVPNAAQQGIGFSTAFEWDIPLLTGYRHRVLASIRLPRPVPSFAQRWGRGIARALDDVRPNVAMVLGWQEISLVQALLACRKRGIPVILRGESNGLRPRPVLVSQLHRHYFGLCDAFLAIGGANTALYLAAGVPENRIIRAGYFVDNDRFAGFAAARAGERETIRCAWSIPKGATCFAFVGKLETKKCVMHYLKALLIALEKSTGVAGLVVGNGPQFDEARRFANEHALPVTFTGFLNQSEIAKAYLAADALVLPSDFGETWGLVVNEAMAAGIPAIVSNRVGSANDLVIDDRTGLIVPFGDVRALAGAMMRLAHDAGARVRMGTEAHRHVNAEYSIARAVERTREAILIALDQRHA